MLPFLNNFMNNRFKVKSRDCKSALFSWQHSNPYKSTGKHLADINNSKMTTSDAMFRSFPNKLLTVRWNERLAWTSENLKTWNLTIKIWVQKPTKKRRPFWLDIFAQLALQWRLIRKQHDFFILMTISSSVSLRQLCLLFIAVVNWATSATASYRTAKSACKTAGTPHGANLSLGRKVLAACLGWCCCTAACSPRQHTCSWLT